MILWVILVGLTGLSVAALLLPLMRRTGQTPKRIDYDLAVYRDQLEEVERDFARGLFDAIQAEAARTEIHRRMIAAEDAETATMEISSKSQRNRQLMGILAVIVLMPAGAMLLYADLGAPELPDQPYAGRAEHDPYFKRMVEVQNELKKMHDQPSADGYKNVGDLYSTLQRYGPAAQAYEEAAKLNPGDAVIWSSLGESLVLMNDGDVVPRARLAFMRAYKLDPGNGRAEFYLGLAAAQGHDLKRAVAIWLHLQKNSAPDAPWTVMVDEHIKAYAAKGGFDPAALRPLSPAK